MSKLKIGIIEDELVIAETIRETLLDLGYEVTEAAINYTEALDLIKKENPDLLLMDIMLSGHKDGIDLAHEVRKKSQIPIVFLTSNFDEGTVNRAKEVHPNGYLVKPFNRQDLFTSIEIAIANFGGEAENSETDKPKEESGVVVKDALFIKQDNLYHKVKFSDILYLQSDHVYIEIFTTEKKFLLRSSLGSFMEKLPKDSFIRIQRGCAINIHHLESINSTYAVVAGQELPIGKTYRDDLMRVLNVG